MEFYNTTEGSHYPNFHHCILLSSNLDSKHGMTSVLMSSQVLATIN